ncbi:putative glycerol kinase 5 isoform X1 [Manis pentadactyla]|uniref:putative glycerol kinase 5 isoform X1 n=1 Tax=Manis pentadactyla TaxID=143292 RepID=UPI00187557A9|nr:putative glycerol kinase 5 isoform X1 [Manis pentadactyla]
MSRLPAVPEQGCPGPSELDSRRAGFVLGLDVGSSVIRCHVYDHAALVRGSSAQKVESLYPQNGWVEIDPDVLWCQFVTVIKDSVQAAGVEMNQIVGLGISTQRATFITWNKRSTMSGGVFVHAVLAKSFTLITKQRLAHSRKTGNHFHNFISWQDLRAIDLVKSWNSSLIMKLIHSSCRVLHFVTRSQRFLAASLFTFTPQHVSLRLAWILQNLIEVQKAIEEDNCCFGTVDTWLLHKLTKGSEFATDFSNASTTGLFDPYEMCWSGLITSLLSIPLSLLPPVRDTSHNFGSVDEEIFGVPIPIVALVADQQSAMFGECCFQAGDVKLTMGTGTFLDINTGSSPQQTLGGFYPLIGWKIGQEVICLAEGNAGDTGTAIKWAQQLDLCTDAAETEKMAKSLEDSEGVYFVPSFNGLQAPLNDPCACASFMGLKPSTSKYHLVRAILESIAFRNKQLYELMQKEVHIPVTKIRADGGVCKNNFVMQMTSDLINETIERPAHTDMSCLGAASLAGLAVGFWTDKEELKKLRQSEMIFKPQKKWQEYEMNMENWVKAVKRSMNWYNKT